jgi:hypothetical protein
MLADSTTALAIKYVVRPHVASELEAAIDPAMKSHHAFHFHALPTQPPVGERGPPTVTAPPGSGLGVVPIQL